MSVASSSEGSSAGLRGKLSRIREIEKSQGLPEAEKALVEAIRDGEQSHMAFLALARILLKQKKYEDAMRAANKAKTIAPLDAEPLVAIGMISLKMEDQARAAQAFADALRIDPSSTRANLGAAAVKMASEDYDDALKICQRVLDLDPSMTKAQELVARINMKRGRSDLAMRDIKTLVEKDPDNRRTMRAYLRLMQSEGQGKEIVDFLKADVEAHPGDKARVNRLSRIAMQAGRPDVVVEHYGHMIDDGRSKMGDRVRYAMALIEAGDIDKAQELAVGMEAQRALKPISALLNGNIALKTGDADLALRHYQASCRAANLPPLDPAEEAAAADPIAKANLWRAHTTKAIMAGKRQRRGSAAQ